MTMPAAMPGPAACANENPSWGTPPDVSACCSPVLLVGVVEGLAVVVMLPSEGCPRWAANHIFPLLSEVKYWTNDPAIGILASLLSPVLGSITAILSIRCSATHRLPLLSMAMPKGAPDSLGDGYLWKVPRSMLNAVTVWLVCSEM